MGGVTHFLNMDHSTISTILKIKGKIMEHVKSAMLMMSTINTEEVWNSDGGDRETSQGAEAESASMSSPVQLNADSRGN